MVSSFWSKTNREDKFKAVITIAATAVIIFLFILRNLKKSKETKIAPLPPGPKGLPVVGYLPFLGPQLHKQFTELNSLYGPIFKLWLGTKLYVVVSSPSLAKEIVRSHDATFANRDPPTVAEIVSYGGNDIAFISHGPKWKKLRKLFVREIMSNSTLDACFPMRKEEVHKTIRHVLQSKIGEVIDLGELIFMTNMNAMMRVIFGSALEGEEGIKAGIEFKTLVSELVVLLGAPNISDFFPVFSRFDLQGLNKKAKKVFKRFETFMDYFIERCLNSRPDNANQENCFLLHFLEFVDHPDPSKSISTSQLKAMLGDIIVGGSDTTSTMLEWTMTELLSYQEIIEKVQQELNEVVGINHFVEEHHLQKLHYLDAVVKETFRLHPAVPLLVPRNPRNSCTIGGYTIPKGASVFLNTYAMHRDPKFWTDPLKFKPERFLNDDENSKIDFSGNNFQYLPFGSGRRICAGLPLAERMLMYQLASLLHAFKWKLPNNTTKLDFTEKFGIVLKKLEPLLAVPEYKLSNLNLYM